MVRQLYSIKYSVPLYIKYYVTVFLYGYYCINRALCSAQLHPGLGLEPPAPYNTALYCITLCQRLRFRFDPYLHLTAWEEAEMIPGENSDTRIKPLALTSDHGRYIAVTPERTLASVEECPLNI
jgi:hypothetical protein